jgi:small subunit ribosomal protein S35
VIPTKRKCLPLPLAPCTPPRRQLSFSSSWLADQPNSNNPSRRHRFRPPVEEEEEDDENLQLPQVDPSEYLTPSDPITADDLDPEERASYETLSTPGREKYLGLKNHYMAVLEQDDKVDPAHLDQQILDMDREIEREAPLGFENVRTKANELGYWGEDDPDEFAQVEDADDDWDESMITAVAESELELHREIREYTRVAAWDMPLLSSTYFKTRPRPSLTFSLEYAQPFDLPATNQVLRFRYTTYMGESHPAEKKVVVEFNTKDLQKAANLSEPQRIKMIKLAGVRYNPSTDVIRMSSERFEHAAQNKRYLGDVVNNLVKEAKNESDMLEDIPLDFRHHKPKPKQVFPEEWKMTGKRIEELQRLRIASAEGQRLLAAREAKRLLEEGEREKNEGAKRVAEYVAAMPLGRRDDSVRR